MNGREIPDAELLEIVGSSVDEDQGAREDGLIVLDHPITEGDKEYDRINLTEPTLYHAMSASQVIGKRPTLATIYDSQIKLVALSANIPEKVVKQFPTRALDEAVSYVMAFEDDVRRPEDFQISDLDLRPEKTILFKVPISGGGREYSDMRLREPQVTEHRRFKAVEGGGSVQDGLKAQMQLIEDVSGWNRAALLRLPMSKFVEAADYLTGFFIAGQQTGKLSR
ncbi:phage tail assembly protein [Gluconobacter cerinus]|uniref:Phage protein n=1 Tax=Gluconobacter cerinus TaxID=38307 RepID=A0AAV5NCK4_9PROT|nr:phage tail assembly protein [Gluconobacter cerinus]GBR03127.1 hypothetical protein AA0229_1868 [Gluconobacter cerinus NRIC 0229]GLQ61548.1 hypothetical protein GCM10007867_03930 [Gluconobacter cerinus]